MPSTFSCKTSTTLLKPLAKQYSLAKVASLLPEWVNRGILPIRSHGDLGMITPKDIVLAISNSGETSEVLMILPIIKRMGIPLIGMASAAQSTLAELSDVFINVPTEQEACPMNLAPTASTTATLAMGDALAIAVLNARDFDESDFARSHPGGTLGRRLLMYVEDIMHKEADIPRVSEDALLSDALVEMTGKGLGMTAIVDQQDKLLGIYTDGDLRRTLAHEIDLNTQIREIMSSGYDENQQN